MAKIRLTQREREVVEDRLNLADCLADALCDDNEDYSREDVEAACGALKPIITGEFDPSELPLVQADVLRDCIEGSTVFAISPDFVTPADRRLARSLVNKLAAGGMTFTTGIPIGESYIQPSGMAD